MLLNEKEMLSFMENTIPDIYKNGYFEIKYFKDASNKNIYVYKDYINDKAIAFENIIGQENINHLFDDIIKNIKDNKINKYGDFVEYNFPDIMKNALKHDVAYHVCTNVRTEDNYINQIGLIANYNHDESVFEASMLLDRNKPKNISYDFYRSNSVYLSRDFSLDFFCKHISMKNDILYAVDISNYDYYIGSSGLGGFLLFFPNNYKDKKEAFEIWSNADKTKENVQLYWENCFTKEQFKKQIQKFIDADNYYGLGEILIPHKISAKHITQIGSWDSNGVFIPTTSLRNFVLDEFKDNYKEILANAFYTTNLII